MFQQTLNHRRKLMHAFLTKVGEEVVVRTSFFKENEIAEMSFEIRNLKGRDPKTALNI